MFSHHWNRYSTNFIITVLKELNHTPFVVTAAVVVSYGDRKKSTRTSSNMQLIFFYWHSEISEEVLRSEKLLINLDSFKK